MNALVNLGKGDFSVLRCEQQAETKFKQASRSTYCFFSSGHQQIFFSILQYIRLDFDNLL